VALLVVVAIAGAGTYLLVHRSSDKHANAAPNATQTPPASEPPTSNPPSDGRFAVAAQIALRQRGEYRAASTKPGSLCIGVARYRDIHSGTRVVVSGSAGHRLVTTRLAPGYLSSDHHCVFAFSVRVATGRGPYQLRISNRPAYFRTEAQLRSLNLALG
jgi:hypothetical protein